MSDINNPYIKNDGNEPEREPIIKPVIAIQQNRLSEVVKISDDYIKKEGHLSASLFIIVSGGIKREKDYFSRIMDFKSFPRIKIYFISKNEETGEEGLSPDKMFNEALKIKEKFQDYYKNNDDEFEKDTIYLVIDVDDFYDKILQIKPLCKNEKFNLIVSNSCFEIWLYYGKNYEYPKDFEIPENKSKISSEFKKYIGDKFKGGIDPRKAIFDIKTAIENSKKNYKEDENEIPELFSTNMFKLATKLLPLTETELQKLIEIEKKRNEDYLKK